MTVPHVYTSSDNINAIAIIFQPEKPTLSCRPLFLQISMIFSSVSSVLPAEDACAKWLRLDLVNWRRAQSSIYFSVTLHKRMRRPFTFSRWGNGCPNGDDGDFGCGYRSGNHQLCIPAKVLTCNALPNCGQEVGRCTVFGQFLYIDTTFTFSLDSSQRRRGVLRQDLRGRPALPHLRAVLPRRSYDLRRVLPIVLRKGQVYVHLF